MTPSKGVATICIPSVPIPLSGFQTGTTMALMASEEVSGEIYVSPPLEEEEEEGTLDEPVSATLVSREAGAKNVVWEQD